MLINRQFSFSRISCFVTRTCAHIHTPIHEHTYTCTHTHAHTYTYTRTFTLAHIHTRTHSHAFTHPHIHGQALFVQLKFTQPLSPHSPLIFLGVRKPTYVVSHNQISPYKVRIGDARRKKKLGIVVSRNDRRSRISRILTLVKFFLHLLEGQKDVSCK